MANLVQQQREHFNGIAEQYVLARTHPNHLLLRSYLERVCKAERVQCLAGASCFGTNVRDD